MSIEFKLKNYVTELMLNLFQNVEHINQMLTLTPTQLVFSSFSLHIDGIFVAGQRNLVIDRVANAHKLHSESNQVTEFLYKAATESSLTQSCDFAELIRPSKNDDLYELVKTVRQQNRVDVNLPPVADLVCSVVGFKGICIGVLLTNYSQSLVSEHVLDVYWITRITNCIDILVEQ